MDCVGLCCSVYVAQFPEYTHAFIDHLVDVKLSHWDRCDSGCALDWLCGMVLCLVPYVYLHLKLFTI